MLSCKLYIKFEQALQHISDTLLSNPDYKPGLFWTNTSSSIFWILLRPTVADRLTSECYVSALNIL